MYGMVPIQTGSRIDGPHPINWLKMCQVKVIRALHKSSRHPRTFTFNLRVFVLSRGTLTIRFVVTSYIEYLYMQIFQK